MLRIVDVDGDNWLSDLHVSGEQMDYVLDPYGILARAYAYRDEGSRAFFVYDGNTPVGMGLYCDYPELKAYELNQFFIDERYQGRGYGKAAMQRVLSYIASKPFGNSNHVSLTCAPDNKAAYGLYKRLGFNESGRSDEDEVELELYLK